MLRCFRDGDELILLPRFDPETLISTIEQRRATSFAGVPTMWIAIANSPDVETRDFSSLRVAASGGAPMPFEMEKRVEQIIGQRLRLGWGMTETAPAGTRTPKSAAPRAGLIGIPYPNIDMRIVSLDDPAKALPPDEIGEIAIRGANVFAGYWKRPDETRDAFVDGWFLTGDIGAMDETGLFRIVDRKKNMIISSGYNVYPTAIENALYDHPDMREAIVIGVPSFEGETWGWSFIIIGSCVWAASQAALPILMRDEGLRLYAGLSRHATPQVLIASAIFETGQLDAIRSAPPLAWAELLFGALIAAALCFSLWYKLLMRVPA